jgi:ATP-binding cassette subfamily B protein/subfamily B ATP-binding cassette protein MsbA
VADFVELGRLNPRSGGNRRFGGLKSGVEFRNVTLRYPENEGNAVDALSFTLRKGQMIAFVGASGSGKSSVINLLLRLYEPSAGNILVDGVDLCELDLGQWRAQIGLVDQETFLFNRSVAENIRFGDPAANDAAVERAAGLAHAEGFIRALPAGFATEIGDRGYRLSGGQRQRLAIARAILRNPSLLIFDEATSHLDSESERSIQAALAALRRERTVVVIAHRLSTVAQADEIFVLEEGKIIERGKHDQLLAQDQRYAGMWRAQTTGGAPLDLANSQPNRDNAQRTSIPPTRPNSPQSDPE